MDTNQQYITNGGKIKIKETKKGTEFHGWNFQRQRMIHIGTLKGQVYEKGNVAILRKPEPSIALSQSEYGAALDAGAQFLRCIPPDKSTTYAISLRDFKANARPYYNPAYGPQIRVSLMMFQRISKVSKRNSMIDNPVIEREAELLPRQMGLFR